MIKDTAINANDATEENEDLDIAQHLSRTILFMMLLVAINSLALRFRKSLSVTHPRIYRIIQDATITTLIGIIAGAILYFAGGTTLLTMIKRGYETLFLIILLPPIIFESTLELNKKSFFANIGSILMFAIFGTGIAIVITAFSFFGISQFSFVKDFSINESLAFGSLISSTDPVTVLAIFKEMGADKRLFTLIFGESILNDAISITAYKTVVAFHKSENASFIQPIFQFILLFIGSLIVGFIIGLICAKILKRRNTGLHINKHPETTETAIMIVAPWVAYLIGEAFELSGIVSILFCGIAINKYAFPNMSEMGKRFTKNLYHIISSTFENIVFMFIGLGFFAFKDDLIFPTVPGILLLSIAIITFARFFQIYFISCIVNCFKHPDHQINNSSKAVMSHSGFRGAMAFALAVNALEQYPDDSTGRIMLTITLVYASMTIFIMGSVMVPLLDYYDVKEKFGKISTVIPPKVGDRGYCWSLFKRPFGKLDSSLKKLLIAAPKEDEDDDEEDTATLDVDAGYKTLADKEVAFLDKEVNSQPESQQQQPILELSDKKSTIGNEFPEGAASNL